MAPILNAQCISKGFGAVPLFSDLSFTLADGARVGLIGPNGSGKSTLLAILSGAMEPDRGDVQRRKHARLSLVEQESHFPRGATVRSVLHSALRPSSFEEGEREGRVQETLGRAGFLDFDAEAASLSGGWRKRLAIARALVESPDVLLLDEPTNHLDIGGIEWLEALIEAGSFACIVVSHDRYFLENVANQTVELSRAYAAGLFRVDGGYSKFLEKKQEFLEAQSKRQETLANRVRGEIEWLRRGPKARATKAKARIDKANELIADLAEISARNRTQTAEIDFSSTERQTKRLIELENLGFEIADNTLFRNLDFAIKAGSRIGLVGPNGSGKTTLLRLLRGEIQPTAGAVRRASALRIVYFDQNRLLDSQLSLRRALAPDSDSVIYQDRTIHVASWAARFLFTGEQLGQPVGRLSGGERARVLIARLMLEPADLLLLDEPTNDLDIPTLEILEESLLEFRGAMVLITHDRFMLDRVSNLVLGLDGRGHAAAFADYSQWEEWRMAQLQNIKQRGAQPRETNKPPVQKKKLSYLEAREFSGMERHIHEEEERLAEARRTVEDPAVAIDAARLEEALSVMEEAQRRIDSLYARWSELDAKIS